MSTRSALFGISEAKLSSLAAGLLAFAVVVCVSAGMIAFVESTHSDCCTLSRPSDAHSYLWLAPVLLAVIMLAACNRVFSRRAVAWSYSTISAQNVLSQVHLRC